MQAVVFADRRGAELAPLCEGECPALLRVANRPLLEYTIEDLVVAGVIEILLVVSDNAARIEEHFGDGSMWGVDIRYLLSRGEESPTRVLARFAALLEPPFLAARGDVLRVAACSRFLAVSASDPRPAIGAAIGGSPIGLCLVREWPAALPGLAWPRDDDPGVQAVEVQVEHAEFAPIDTLQDFHSASLRQVRSGPPGVELAPGVHVERLSRIEPTSRASGEVAVGARAWVHGTVRLAGACVIGSDSYIDRHVQIRDSVVMPGTYVGECLQLENAIVSGRHLIRIDLGARVEIDEPALLGTNGSETSRFLRHWGERAIGAVVLALSLPLWPAALLASMACSPRAPLKRWWILGNRRRLNRDVAQGVAVTAWKFATPIPVLRHLPMLWLVMCGDLRLFGAAPLVVGEGGGARAAHRDEVMVDARGLLGPAALYLPREAPREEVQLSEAEFVADASAAALLRRIGAAVRLLASPRAWRPRDAIGMDV